MTSLTTRGRVAVVAGLLASAGLCAGAAVALVKASDHSAPTTLPQAHPTLLFPSSSPTAAPSASPAPVSTPTPAATTRASAGPSASPTAARATASSSPRPVRRTTHQPTSYPVPAGPAVTASVDPVAGQPGSVLLRVHATSDAGPLVLKSVTWGDGASDDTAQGTACSASAGGDCEDFRATHLYQAPYRQSGYDVTVVVADAVGSTTVVMHVTVGGV